MSKDVTFADAVVEAVRSAKILGSWNDKPTGWFRAFKKQPVGAIKIGTLEIPVRAKPVRGARILDAVTAAFGEKYNTKASRKWVEGFAEPARARATLEFAPA